MKDNKKSSLKKSLHALISTKDFTSYGEVVNLALELGHRISNAERRLRPSESPNIQTILSKKGYILGYKLSDA